MDSKDMRRLMDALEHSKEGIATGPYLSDFEIK